MKRITTILLSVLLTTNIFAQKNLSNELDSASYAIGCIIATNMADEISSMGLSQDMFIKGFSDMLKKEKMSISTDQLHAVAEKYFKKIQQKEEADMQEQCLKNSDWLLENKNNKGVETLENGLQYKIVKKGDGKETPTDNDLVTVHYKGSLIDGTTFDSSIDRGEPATFPVNGVIPGFSQILKMMTVGSTYIAYIPSDLGYGMHGAGSSIKPCSTLIFEIQLLEIKKGNVSTEEAITEEEEAPTSDKKQAKKNKKK